MLSSQPSPSLPQQSSSSSDANPEMLFSSETSFVGEEHGVDVVDVDSSYVLIGGQRVTKQDLVDLLDEFSARAEKGEVGFEIFIGGKGATKKEMDGLVEMFYYETKCFHLGIVDDRLKIIKCIGGMPRQAVVGEMLRQFDRWRCSPHNCVDEEEEFDAMTDVKLPSINGCAVDVALGPEDEFSPRLIVEVVHRCGSSIADVRERCLTFARRDPMIQVIVIVVFDDKARSSFAIKFQRRGSAGEEGGGGEMEYIESASFGERDVDADQLAQWQKHMDNALPPIPTPVDGHNQVALHTASSPPPPCSLLITFWVNMVRDGVAIPLPASVTPLEINLRALHQKFANRGGYDYVF